MSASMSAADAAWLHMDRPTNLMVINSVMLFDEPIDVELVTELIESRLVAPYPRFRQRVIESRLPLMPPRWVDDPDFALEHHIHHLALPAPGDRAVLQQFVADLMSTPLDRNRPLWQLYIVDGLGDGSAIVCRMHHCIADGIALAQVMLSLTDPAPDCAAEPAGEPPAHEARPGWPGLGTIRMLTGAVRHGARAATSLSYAAELTRAVTRDAGTAVRIILTPGDGPTAMKGDPHVSRRVVWSDPLPLSKIKKIAHLQDATVNDILLAGVAGALRHYLQDHGSATPDVQAMVPFNLRPAGGQLDPELGNRFGLVFVPLPVGTSGGYHRLVSIRRRMRQIKLGRDGPVSYGLLSLTGLTPEPIERRIVDVLSAKSTAVITNVPGPREPVYLAGVPIRTVLVWAPTSGHMSTSVSIFSYRGEVTVGLMVDAKLVPDPEQIVAGLERELESLVEFPTLHTHPRRRPARRRAAERKVSAR